MGLTQGARKSAQNEEKLVNDEEERVVVEDAKVTKKPRKKSQAFGVPKTAALKAKIDRNVAESPLLRLPREVRTRIWVLVIGNRLLHIRTLCKVHPEVDHCHCYATVSEKVWTTSCCILLNSERDFFRRSKILIEELVIQDEGEYGSHLNAAALRKLSSCSAERTEERKLHLQRAPHYQCRHYLKDIRSGKCNVLDGRALEIYQAGEHVIQDAVYSNNCPAAGNFDDKQETEEWQSSTKTQEALGSLTNFKRLPLQDVTVLMLCKPEWSISMQDWHHAERIKYAEAVRDTILDPEGSQKLQQEQADTKAARKAELAQLKSASPPCVKFSTVEECAKANQEDIDRLRIANGKSRSSRPQAQACRAELVCLVCLLTLDQTRQEARQCQKPDRCAEAYFSIMFKNSDHPHLSMNISVRPEDTISTILDRCIGVSGINKYISYDVQLEKVVLKPEATVHDVGLKRDCKLEVVVAITWTNLTSLLDL